MSYQQPVHSPDMITEELAGIWGNYYSSAFQEAQQNIHSQLDAPATTGIVGPSDNIMSLAPSLKIAPSLGDGSLFDLTPSFSLGLNNISASPRALDPSLVVQLCPEAATGLGGPSPVANPSTAAINDQPVVPGFQQPERGFSGMMIDSLPFHAEDHMDEGFDPMGGEQWLDLHLQAAMEVADIDEALLATIPPPNPLSSASNSQDVAHSAAELATGPASSGEAAVNTQQQGDYYKDDDDEEDDFEEPESDDDEDEYGVKRTQKKKKNASRASTAGKSKAASSRSQAAATKGGSSGGGGVPKSSSSRLKTQDQVQRNRDAQKRFREKQKLLKKEIELQVEKVNEQMQEVQKQHDAEVRKGELLSKMIACKEDQMAMLSANLKALEDPETLTAGLQVPVDLHRLELMYKLSVPGAFNLDRLLRFTPAGCQTHLAPDGRAKERPPLMHLVLEWNRFVLSAKKILDAAATAANVPARIRHRAGFSHPANAVLWVHEKAPFSKVAQELLNEPGFNEEVVVQSAGMSYKFTSGSLKELNSLLHRMGTMNWELVTLFPEAMLELASTKATTGELADPARLESLERWRAVLRALGLRKEQLESIVVAHRKFAAEMVPLREARPKILHELEMVAAVDDLVKLEELTAQLAENSRLEFQAWAELAGRIRGTLDVPVQIARLYILSWSFWPQQNIIGTAAALELGLEPAWKLISVYKPKK